MKTDYLVIFFKNNSDRCIVQRKFTIMTCLTTEGNSYELYELHHWVTRTVCASVSSLVVYTGVHAHLLYLEGLTILSLSLSLSLSLLQFSFTRGHHGTGVVTIAGKNRSFGLYVYVNIILLMSTNIHAYPEGT